jgi:hypothetical protein
MMPDTREGRLRRLASDLAVEGELAGAQLTFGTSFFTEWYGWAAFHPDTTSHAAFAR